MGSKNLYPEFVEYIDRSPFDEDIIRMLSLETHEDLHSRLNELMEESIYFMGLLNRSQTLRLILDIETYKPERGFKLKGIKPIPPIKLRHASVVYKELMVQYIKFNTGIEVSTNTGLPVHFYESLANKLEI
jgi:hypothetical protein